MTLIKVLLFCVFFTQQLAHARLVQILHTNDLHSYFEGTRFGQGGYARLKTIIDQLKNEAKNNGIETLFVDGGDFGEGSSYFFSNEGVDSLRALDLLGIDVTVLGNHDYLLGGDVLARQIKAANLKTKILSSNLRGKKRLGLKGLVINDHQIEIDGTKIFIFGLSTAEAHFMYPIAWKGFIRPPLESFSKMENKAAKAQADFVIALTHIGLEKDIELAKKSKSIDLIVGGHSHSRSNEIRYEFNKEMKPTPILQAGANGIAIGRLLLDLKPNHESQVISYEILDVTNKIQPNTELVNFVELAQTKREEYFSRSWDEIIGSTEITLSGFKPNGKMNEDTTCWGMHLAHMAQNITKTDIGVHHSSFEGEEIQPGVLRFGDMIDNYPHFRKFGDKGWEIVRSDIPGWMLKKILKFVYPKPGMAGMSITGLHWPDHVEKKGDKLDAEYAVNNVLIKGEKIKKLKYYSMGYTSEMVFAIKKMLPGLSKLLLPKLAYSREYYWPSIEKYIRDNSPLTCKLP